MDKARRKQIARAWSDRERSQGVFAVRCLASGEVWVSSTPNLDRRQNGLWFMLRQGGHPNPRLQAAWRTHGEAAFAYEVLTEEGSTSAGFSDRLKAREAYWREALGASALIG